MSAPRSASSAAAIGLMALAAIWVPPVHSAPGAEFSTTDEGIIGTYRRAVPNVDFNTAKARDEQNKPRVMQRKQNLLRERYDLSNRPSRVMMSGGQA